MFLLCLRRQEEFGRMDENHDGTVDIDELYRYLDPSHEQHSVNEAKYLISVSDRNHDGKLSEREMLMNYQLFTGSSMSNFPGALHDEFWGRGHITSWELLLQRNVEVEGRGGKGIKGNPSIGDLYNYAMCWQTTRKETVNNVENWARQEETKIISHATRYQRSHVQEYNTSVMFVERLMIFVFQVVRGAYSKIEASEGGLNRAFMVCPGGGVTPIYLLGRDVPPVRVSLSGSSVLNRVYNFTFLSPKQGRPHKSSPFLPLQSHNFRWFRLPHWNALKSKLP